MAATTDEIMEGLTQATKLIRALLSDFQKVEKNVEAIRKDQAAMREDMKKPLAKEGR